MLNVKMSEERRHRLIALSHLVVKNFNGGDWHTLSIYTDASDLVNGHHRLLRSLSFGDEDYEGHAIAAIFAIVEKHARNFDIINDFVTQRYGEPEAFTIASGENVSTATSKSRKIVFAPSVFDVPEGGVENDLIAVMTPFAPQFESVFSSISFAAGQAGYGALRAKDIWEHSTVIQDVFSLIFRAKIVVCDFTGKNPNVFYEAGIAHALGKHVVPITQSAEDIPFDLRHHRYLTYLGNNEGRAALGIELVKRFSTLA